MAKKKSSKKSSKKSIKKSSKIPEGVTVVPSDDFPDDVAGEIDDLAAALAPSPSESRRIKALLTPEKSESEDPKGDSEALQHPVKRNKSALEKIADREREIRALQDNPVPVFTPSGIATHPNTKGNKAVLPSPDGHRKVDKEFRRKRGEAQEGGTDKVAGPSGAPRPKKGGKNEATLPSSAGAQKVTDDFVTKKAKAQDGGDDEVATPFGMHKPSYRPGGVSLPKMKPGN